MIGLLIGMVGAAFGIVAGLAGAVIGVAAGLFGLLLPMSPFVLFLLAIFILVKRSDAAAGTRADR